jgi:hypothetical protein
MIKKLIIFLVLLNYQVLGQEEKVLIDSSGVIIIKHYEGKYLDFTNWSCIISTKKQSFESNKALKKVQENIVFLYPYDFDTKQDSAENYALVIKKGDKIIFEENIYFDFNPKGKFQLLSNHTISKQTKKKVRGEIIDSYFFETKTNEHVVIRSVSDEKRVYFYHLIEDEIINIHTDILDYKSLSLQKKPILITDLNNDFSPEITFKYSTKTKDKIVLFNREKKFIIRNEKEEITFSESLNDLENCFFKQHLINEINSKSE